jgi:ribosomal 30S subunit maturation factor RimM
MPAKQQTSGSPAGEPVYLVIGYLRRAHGVRGEIIMDLHTDFPAASMMFSKSTKTGNVLSAIKSQGFSK